MTIEQLTIEEFQQRASVMSLAELQKRKHELKCHAKRLGFILDTSDFALEQDIIQAELRTRWQSEIKTQNSG